MSKINCVFHTDNTASLHLYGDRFYCYGCGATGPTEEVEKRAGKRISTPRGGYRQAENVKESLARIAALPTKEIRGFLLPYDDTGYYIPYPHADYYVKRLWEPKNGDSDKYRGPTGHRKPLFKAVQGDYNGMLIIVEGELNAASCAVAMRSVDKVTIVGVGGVSNLCRKDFVDYFLCYTRIYIIVDKDAAGVMAGTQLRDTLLKNNRQVVLHAVEKDFNELLCEQGEKAVRAEIGKDLGLLPRLRCE